MGTASNTLDIMLVEDEEAHAELIRRAFEGQPRFELVCVGSLKEANERLDQAAPHLVISDYRLPDGEGTQLIRSKNGVRPPPVVVMTSHGNEAVAVDAMKVGAIDYVVKSPEMFADMPHVAERALRAWSNIVERDEALERLRLVTDAVPALIAYVDATLRFRFVNAGFQRWFGHPVDWFIDRTVHSVVGDEAYQVLDGTFARALSGETATVERWMKKPNGSACYVRQELVPHRGDGNVVLGCYVLMTDLTEMKHLQQKLVDGERLATVGTTAAMFAHEVGNPLNNMYLHLQLLDRNLRKNDGEQFLDEVKFLKDEIMRLDGLLNDFRSLAKNRDFAVEPVDLARVLADTITRHVHADNVSVTRVLDDTLPPLVANPDKLKQVFLNLLKNAVEAMPDGGELRVVLRRDGETFVVEVTDTGVGIPPDVDVFEPFKTTKPAGTGLGLAVVKQIVTGHGGTIEHNSESGGGTTFRVVLPCPDPRS
jgi:PAS domain S-box-containing protein